MKLLDTTSLDSRIDQTRISGKETPPVLRVENLSVALSVDREREVFPVRNVSFAISPGQVLGILGESGAGKSTLALALLKLLTPPLRVCSGAIQFHGRDVLTLRESELREVRGAEISLVYQDSSVLNPVLRIGAQVSEVLRAHRNWPKRECDEHARRLLAMVGLGDDAIPNAYPHQLSGGQRQRVAIAQAIVCEPALVIADEPTAALDPDTGRGILELFAMLRRKLGTSFLIISHDPDVLAKLADRIMVMYAGEVIEEGDTRDVLKGALHPYTRELLRCQLDSNEEIAPTGRRQLRFIPGTPPDLMATVTGCSFESRCPERRDLCRVCSPAETKPFGSHRVRCHEYGDGA